MKINWLKLINREEDLFFYIEAILYSGRRTEVFAGVNDFSAFMNLIKQGYICKDCDCCFDYCECESYNYILDIQKFVISFLIYNVSKIYYDKFFNAKTFLSIKHRKIYKKYANLFKKLIIQHAP